MFRANKSAPDFLKSDLNDIIRHTTGLWEDLRGERLFLTGGTGFFGCWLLESFIHANRELNLDASMLVLTRDGQLFRGRWPHLTLDSAVSFHEGDVRTFDYPRGRFSHVIHAATPATGVHSAANTLDVTIDGTRRVLDFAVMCGAKRFLLTSSGAVYGKQPASLTHMPETYGGAPDPMNPGAAYGAGKRMAELLCATYSAEHALETLIARCFAFVGPYLPLEEHFAAGNFVRDVLRGGPIRVNGDGTTLRSYLYASDLMIWLWTILFRGETCRPYNVGSGEAVSIRTLAETAAELRAGVQVEIGREAVAGVQPERYVPDVTRAKEELGLVERVGLQGGLNRLADWAS